MRRVNKFKGPDNKTSSTQRAQLPEGTDVTSHKQEVARNYPTRKDDYLIKAKGINKVY